MAKRFTIESVFKAVDRVTAPVNRMQAKVGKFTRSMDRGFFKLNRTVGKFGGGVKKVGIAIVASLALASTAMAGVISTGAKFEQTLVSAAAKFPGEIRRGTAAFEQLEAAARRTGRTTEFTASQSAEAINFLAMAGFTAEQSIAALPGVVNLATAASIDLGRATDIATDSLGAFNLTSKDAVKQAKNLTRINDVIARTSTSANTTVEQMFEAIKEGAPIATTAGASLETFSALVGQMANAGIKGSRAGTTLKNMFVKLAAPEAVGAKLLRRFRIETQDASGDFRDIVDILDDLDKSLAGLGTAQRSAVLEGIFGKIPLAGVNVLLAAGSDKLREYRRQLEGAAGASTTMATVMRDTMQGRLDALRSAVESVSISIFTMNNGPMADAVTALTKWVRANEEVLASGISEFLALVLNNLGPIAQGFRDIAVAVAFLVGFTVVLKAVAAVLALINLLVLANPIVLIILAAVAAVAILVAALTDVMGTLKKIGGFFSGAFGAVGKVLDLFAGDIGVDAPDAPDKSGAVGAVHGMSRLFGGDDEDEAREAPAEKGNVISTQARIVQAIEERTTNTAEVTIKAEEGTSAELTKGKMGFGIALQPTGAF